MKIIYTETPEVSLEGRHFCLDVGSREWKKSSSALMSKIEAPGDSSMERALKLCIFENELYEESGASKFQYTLILGRETEEDGSRVLRVGVVKGILTSKMGGLVPMKRKVEDTQKRRPLPPGVILDQR